MRSHNNVAFGQVLRGLRKARGYSQESLAFASGRDRTYISLLELGQRSPTLDTMISLCQALAITLPQLAAAVQEHLDNQTGSRASSAEPKSP